MTRATLIKTAFVACVFAMLFGLQRIAEGQMLLRVAERAAVAQSGATPDASNASLGEAFMTLPAVIAATLVPSADIAGELAEIARGEIMKGYALLGASLAGLLVVAVVYFR